MTQHFATKDLDLDWSDITAAEEALGRSRSDIETNGLTLDEIDRVAFHVEEEYGKVDQDSTAAIELDGDYSHLHKEAEELRQQAAKLARLTTAEGQVEVAERIRERIRIASLPVVRFRDFRPISDTNSESRGLLGFLKRTRAKQCEPPADVMGRINAWIRAENVTTVLNVETVFDSNASSLRMEDAAIRVWYIESSDSLT